MSGQTVGEECRISGHIWPEHLVREKITKVRPSENITITCGACGSTKTYVRKGSDIVTVRYKYAPGYLKDSDA